MVATVSHRYPYGCNPYGSPSCALVRPSLGDFVGENRADLGATVVSSKRFAPLQTRPGVPVGSEEVPVNAPECEDLRPAAMPAASPFTNAPSAPWGLGRFCDLVERCFAEFARVPYESAGIRGEWEDLWKTEDECMNERLRAPP